MNKNRFFLGLKNIVVVFLVVFSVGGYNAQALDSTTYNQKKNSINSKVSEIQNNIGGINKNYEDVGRQADTLEDEVIRINQEIATTQKVITDSQALILVIASQIEQNNQNISNLKEQIKELLKEIQKNSKISPLQNLVSSRNFGEALGKIYSLSSIQNKVDELKNSLELQTTELNENKQNQEITKANAENAKVLLAAKKENVQLLVDTYRGKESEYAKQASELKAQQKALAEQAAKNESEWKAQLAKDEADRRAAEAAKIKAINRQVGYTGGYTPSRGKCWFEDGGNPGIPDGYFTNPASGIITTNYGCPAVTGYPHDGVDIANSRGTRISAAASGVVERTGIGGWNGGFGNFILIKHTLPSGNRLYTLYGHLDSVETSAGSAVSKGQRIGSMGTTGNSTGFHLHFMVITSSYETSGMGCYYGSSKCIDPFRFISF